MRYSRRARRWHKICPCAEAWRVQLEVLNVKGKAIRKAKAVHLKQAIVNVARGRGCI
jgi:hypothetical protein